MHPLVELAKKTVEEFVRHGRVLPPPSSFPPGFDQKAGVFVSIKSHGALRGCIGTFLPTTESLLQETISNAVSAATRDPRFPPVSEDELPDLVYSVDLLSAPEPVENTKDLDPLKFGIIVEAGHRRGLLLPDLEGVDTVDEQLRITRMKAGIRPDEPVRISRFTVARYR